MSQIGTLVQTVAKGGPVMIPLLACSIVAVVVERLAFRWRQGDPGSALRALELAEAAAQAGVGKLAIAVSPREARR